MRGQTRPKRDSLRLLPSGPDRVGEANARADLSMHQIVPIGGFDKPILPPWASWEIRITPDATQGGRGVCERQKM